MRRDVGVVSRVEHDSERASGLVRPRSKRDRVAVNRAIRVGEEERDFINCLAHHQRLGSVIEELDSENCEVTTMHLLSKDKLGCGSIKLGDIGVGGLLDMCIVSEATVDNFLKCRTVVQRGNLTVTFRDETTKDMRVRSSFVAGCLQHTASLLVEKFTNAGLSWDLGISVQGGLE